MNKEVWKDIPDYEGLYKYSNLLNIKNTKRNTLLKADRDGFSLYKNGVVEWFSVGKIKKHFVENELLLIKDYIKYFAGFDLSDKKRLKENVKLRVVFTKLALENSLGSPKEILLFIHRDRTSLYHYKKLFEEVLNIGAYSDLYLGYNNDNFNEYLFSKQNIKLTTNEIKYRELSKEQQKDYNFRVEPILRMMNLKERKEVTKYERINCEM